MSADGRKYFFDVNNFDANIKPEPEEDIPPPPPTFSLEELGQTKDEGFKQGLEQGRLEEQTSRGAYIAAQISELNTEIRALFLSEQMREKKYERDVVFLCRALVERLFPAFVAAQGFGEIERVILEVLARQPEKTIRIEVPQADVEEIVTTLTSIHNADFARLTITGVESLNPGNCRMSWEDGGAVRDHDRILGDIMKELDDVLALEHQKGQNSESGEPDILRTTDE
ncbi:MAG: hypothetical protein WC043_04965 [Pseudobdellovibrionaceae bacterium]